MHEITPHLDRQPSIASIKSSTPRRNLARTHRYDPHDPKVRGQSLQSKPADLGLTPRRSHSYNGNNLSEHSREHHNLDLHLNQDPLQSKRHRVEIGTNRNIANMVKNTTTPTIHTRQDLHPGPSAKRTRHQDAKGASNSNFNHTNQTFKPHIGNPRKHNRHNDEKGVSNFHLDQNDQIVRTYAGHPRCNYCFVASHPRTGCKTGKRT